MRWPSCCALWRRRRNGRPRVPPTARIRRSRLLEHEVADRFFAEVVAQAKLRRYVSSEHFSVDGKLLEAWAIAQVVQAKGPAAR